MSQEDIACPIDNRLRRIPSKKEILKRMRLSKQQQTTEHDACGVGFIYRPQSRHATISDAIRALVQLEHRGACAADGISGDGAGILTEIPKEIFRQEGVEIAENDALAVLFLPRIESYRRLIEEFL